MRKEPELDVVEDIASNAKARQSSQSQPSSAKSPNVRSKAMMECEEPEGQRKDKDVVPRARWSGRWQ